MSDVSKRFVLYTALAVALCAFCWVAGHTSAIDDLTVDRAQSLVNGHRGYERALSALRTLAADEARRADSLAKTPRYVQVVTAHHDTVTMLDTVWVAQRVTALQGAYQACSEGLTLCRARGDSLQAALEGMLKVRACHVLFVPCPSRTVTFFLGAVGGALLEHRLTH